MTSKFVKHYYISSEIIVRIFSNFLLLVGYSEHEVTSDTHWNLRCILLGIAVKNKNKVAAAIGYWNSKHYCSFCGAYFLLLGLLVI